MLAIFICYILWLYNYCKVKKPKSFKQFLIKKCFYPPHLINLKKEYSIESKRANIFSILFWTLLFLGVLLGFIFVAPPKLI